MAENERDHAGGGMGYGPFGAMIIASTVMIFGPVYLDIYAPDHLPFSQTGIALYTGGAMAIITLALIQGMYTNRKVDRVVVSGTASRSQGEPDLAVQRSRSATSRE